MPKIDNHHHETLRKVLSRLTKSGVIPLAAPALDVRRQATGSTLRTAVLAEVPAYSDSGNPDILPGLDVHIEEHIEEIRRLFQGGDVRTTDAQRRQGETSRFEFEQR